MKKHLMFLIPILLVAIFFFLNSGYHLILWNMDNHKTSVIANHIKIISKEEVKEDKFLRVDFNHLLLKNKEVVGFIKVNGTNIDYPVVKHSDNEYYLTHSFDHSYNQAGWIFMDTRNNIDAMDFNTIIYGHGRRDGSMFGSLFQTLNKEWIDNEENLTIYFATLQHSYLFKIFSIYSIDTTNDYIEINSSDELIHKMIKRSIYSLDTDISNNDRILTLSTCYNNDKKLVIHAKMIDYN